MTNNNMNMFAVIAAIKNSKKAIEELKEKRFNNEITEEQYEEEKRKIGESLNGNSPVVH